MQIDQLAVRLRLWLRMCQYFHHNKTLCCFLLRWKCLSCIENFYMSPSASWKLKMKLHREFNKTYTVYFFQMSFFQYLLYSVLIKGDEPYRV